LEEICVEGEVEEVVGAERKKNKKKNKKEEKNKKKNKK
jgi:hypothetical protein